MIYDVILKRWVPAPGGSVSYSSAFNNEPVPREEADFLAAELNRAIDSGRMTGSVTIIPALMREWVPMIGRQA